MKRLFVLVLALLLAASACSSDTEIDAAAVSDAVDELEPGNDAPTASTESNDSNGGDEAPAEPTAAPAQAEPTATTAPEPAADADAEPEPEPADEPEAESVDERLETILLSDDWCEASVTLDETFSDLDVINPADPVALEATYTRMVGMLGVIEGIAPDEIAADVRQTRVGFEAFAAALEEAEWSFLDVDLSVIEQLDGPMEQATFNIERYNFEVCGIDNGFDPSAQPGDFTSEVPDDVPSDLGTARELAVDSLLDVGFSVEEANCFVNNLDVSNPEAMTDGSAVLAIFEECGISLERLADLGG